MTNTTQSKPIEELKEKLTILRDQNIIDIKVDERLLLLEKLELMLEKKKNDSELNSYLKLFKALGNKNRLLILWLIMKGICCACEIEHILDLSQSTVSHHINELVEVGAIKIIKSGKWSLVSSESSVLSEDFFIELIKKT